MNSLRNWWHTKTATQKNNWRLLALVLVLIAGGFVESYTWFALVGVIPAGIIVYLESTDERY